MREAFRRVPPIFISVVIATAYALAWNAGTGVAINLSPSMPIGVYLSRPIADPKPGDLVSVCIPPSPASIYADRSYVPRSPRCPSGLAPVIKPIAAADGDVVSIEPDGTRVNANLVPNSLVFDTDSNGRPIPHLPHGWIKRLNTGEYFVMATVLPRSLDSRYYGLVSRNQLLQKLIPLLTS